MKVLRVRQGGRIFYGQLLLENNAVLCLDRSLNLPDPIPLEDVSVLPPVSPSKVVCAAANYPERLDAMGWDADDVPMLYLRPPSAVIGSGQPIVLPCGVSRVEAGGQLAIVLGRGCRNVPPDAVGRHLFGFSCAGDLVAADGDSGDTTLCRASAFDSFAPIGPWIETAVADPDNLAIRAMVNGACVQETSTGAMLMTPFDLVSFVSSIMTLLPGDVILTGSPGTGAGLAPGDEVRVEIDEVGVLINTARRETVAAPLQ